MWSRRREVVCTVDLQLRCGPPCAEHASALFTALDNALVQKLELGDRAIATFASKGHDLFATLHGSVSLDNDRAVIDRLWNRFVAAWYEGGKDDPKLALLRFDAERAEIWLDASSLVAGIKLLLGADPKQDYKENVAEVDLRR